MCWPTHNSTRMQSKEWASNRERERVVGTGVVDVLPKIGAELKYPLSIEIPYYRSSGRTISNI